MRNTMLSLTIIPVIWWFFWNFSANVSKRFELLVSKFFEYDNVLDYGIFVDQW